MMTTSSPSFALHDTSNVFDWHHFNVSALTFERAMINARRAWLDARQHHLRTASSADWRLDIVW
jgi:hypothetical protein